MGIITCLVIGLTAGFVASLLVNRAGSGLITDVSLGMIGAVVGAVLFSYFGRGGAIAFNLFAALEINLYGALSETAGAVGMLFLFHALAGRRNI